ncbi:MAG: hypothetical protein ACPGFA_04950 [Pikeienuella sp.]
MPKSKRHSPEFTVKVALAALTGERTAAERSGQSGARPTMTHRWQHGAYAERWASGQ